MEAARIHRLEERINKMREKHVPYAVQDATLSRCGPGAAGRGRQGEGWGVPVPVSWDAIYGSQLETQW